MSNWFCGFSAIVFSLWDSISNVVSFWEIHDVCFYFDAIFFLLFYVVCQPTRHSLYRKFELRAFHLACHSFVHTNILTTPTQPVALYPTGCARVLPPLILLGNDLDITFSPFLYFHFRRKYYLLSISNKIVHVYNSISPDILHPFKQTLLSILPHQF